LLPITGVANHPSKTKLLFWNIKKPRRLHGEPGWPSLYPNFSWWSESFKDLLRSKESIFLLEKPKSFYWIKLNVLVNS